MLKKIICPNCDNTGGGFIANKSEKRYVCTGCKFAFGKKVDIERVRKKLVIIAIIGPESNRYDPELLVRLNCSMIDMKKDIR